MNLGIVISTYMRKDNKTLELLKRALNSVFSQTHKDFKIFLIGDRYENQEEINNLVSIYPADKLYFENLPFAAERDNYTDKYVLWSYGGVNAVNYGLDVAMTNGYEYICHLDHDDYWSNTHLEEISKCLQHTNSDWVCTKSKYISDLIYPTYNCSNIYCDFIPIPGGLIHSSTCMNFKKIPLKYRDLYKETGTIGIPADADLWSRVASFVQKNNFKTTLINKITCFHIEEGYERK